MRQLLADWNEKKKRITGWEKGRILWRVIDEGNWLGGGSLGFGLQETRLRPWPRLVGWPEPLSCGRRGPLQQDLSQFNFLLDCGRVGKVGRVTTQGGDL